MLILNHGILRGVLAPPIPDAPTATAASDITTTSFTANWNAVTGATSYRLDVSTLSNFSTFVSGYENLTVAGTSQAVSGLTAGVTYYYRVRAVNTGGTSGNSNTTSQGTIPLAPTATNGSAATDVQFTANWNAVSGAASYRLDVSTASDFSSFVSGYNDKSVSGTSDVVTGLSTGVTYYYRLRTVSAFGLISADGVATSWVTLTVPPVANAATNVGSTSFVANWNAVTNAASYRLDVCLVNTFDSDFVAGYNDKSVAGLSDLVEGLSGGTTYYWRVSSINSQGYRSVSPIYSSTMTQVTTLAAPVATAATSVLTTSFQANWNAVGGASGYRLDVTYEVGEEEFFVAGYNNKSVAGTSDSVTGLTAGVEYTYRVRAVNIGGTSENSNAIEIYTVTNAPVATAATSVGQTSFTANWGAVTGADSYRLDVSTSSGFGSFVSGYNGKVVSGTSDSVTGLTAGTTYYYRVRAVNPDAYASANSNVITQATASAIPATPTGLTVTNNESDGVNVSWNSVSGATRYEFQFNIDGGFYGSWTNNGTNTTVSITGYSEGTTICVKVRACNSSGCSSESSPACDTVGSGS